MGRAAKRVSSANWEWVIRGPCILMSRPAILPENCKCLRPLPKSRPPALVASDRDFWLGFGLSRRVAGGSESPPRMKPSAGSAGCLARNGLRASAMRHLSCLQSTLPINQESITSIVVFCFTVSPEFLFFLFFSHVLSSPWETRWTERGFMEDYLQILGKGGTSKGMINIKKQKNTNYRL